LGALSVSTPGSERRASLVDDAERRGGEVIDGSDEPSASRKARSSKGAQLVVGALVLGAIVVAGIALTRGSGGSSQAVARPLAAPVASLSGDVGVGGSTPEKVSEKVSERVSATASADTPGHLPAAVVLTPSNEGAPPATSTSAVKGSKPSAAPKSQALAVPGPTTPPKRPVSDLYTP
jgi:outer membrane murein-binding lipoprotein Lpp